MLSRTTLFGGGAALSALALALLQLLGQPLPWPNAVVLVAGLACSALVGVYAVSHGEQPRGAPPSDPPTPPDGAPPADPPAGG